MFHKKKFTLVEQKNEKKMYSARPNVKWLNYVVLVALIGFVLLMILANVKSKSYYQNQNASTKALALKSSSATRSILSLDEISSRAISCTVTSCAVSCTGDMTDLSTYLNNVKSCQSLSLTITDGTFPDDRLKSDWLKGGYDLDYINITRATLTAIDNGAFDRHTVAYMTELKLDGVQLGALTENSFVGLEALNTFTLINEVEVFSGDGFLKPLAKKLKSLTIQHITSTATDPAPWLRGGDFPELLSVDFDNSNFGDCITLDTFPHLKQLQTLSLSYCKISYLPDGIFDFMMGQLVVNIFVDNNQLERLAGDYLNEVKANSKKYVHLENNPWDCTCELEELMTAYKRYPAGFGTPVECSTPSQYAGKVLSDVVVVPCGETTTALITTTDPTTLSSLSTSTVETTESSTTESSTTESSTTELSTTTSSTNIPELSPNTNQTTVSTTHSTSDLTTVTEDGTTRSSPPTTPSPQNRTTTMSADGIVSIECKRYSIDSSESPGLTVELARPDTQFNITFRNETSAVMTMEVTADDLALIWFYDQPVLDGTRGNVQIMGEFKLGCQSDLGNSLLIAGLTRNRAYTFCLVKEGVQLISPFNCLSYYTKTMCEGDCEVWLKYKDKALMISLFILGIVISICIGAGGMFFCLRAYPALLKGSKRVIVVNRSTGDVLIMPRPRGKSSVTESSYRDSFETNTTIRQRRSSEVSVQSGRSYMMANNYEDIGYQWKMNVVNDMIYANRIPKSPPPPLPKRISQDTSLTKENVNKMQVAVVYQKGNDYGYIP